MDFELRNRKKQICLAVLKCAEDAAKELAS
jgi:hypothetical protein